MKNKLWQYKDSQKHPHDSLAGEVFIIGGGPSLLRTPPETFELRDSVAINYFPYYSEMVWGKKVLPRYFISMDATVIFDTLDDTPGVPKFMYAATPGVRQKVGKHKEVVWWIDTEPKDGILWRDQGGNFYPSTGHGAAWLAGYMGYHTVLLLGMDCTTGKYKPEQPARGKGFIPHFYDPVHEPLYSETWDRHWGLMRQHLEPSGVTMVNLSPQAMCTSIPWMNLEHWDRNKPMKEQLGLTVDHSFNRPWDERPEKKFTELPEDEEVLWG